ncbi:hypothetical protein [Marinobacter shengliensis]|uniref:hypothetical protein n=1 Tax=Marinobacter shengliensis TaxID=1389223 RepID=UPI0011088093|nr:hypothetical protein [Marinobacter shengliensis]
MTNHDIDSESDLFQAQESLPDNVRAIIDHHTALIEENEGDAYMLCRDFLADMQAAGYAFDYGLDGVPFDLKPLDS